MPRAASPRATWRGACRPRQLRTGSSELGELAVQFNTMADRLEESVEIIRRDRDRSRDFLADVSHELRTPLAALRTFNQLLMETRRRRPGGPGRVPRVERRPDRAPRLARPEPARAVEARLRAGPARPAPGRPARRRRVGGPPARCRRGPARRDPRGRPAGRRPSASATTRRASARSWPTSSATPSSSRRAAAPSGSTVAPTADGARIDVTDTGVGIDPTELPAHLRALLPRLARQRGARQRQRPGPGHRPVDRRHARRDGRRSRAGPGSGSRFTVDCRAIRGPWPARRPRGARTWPRPPRARTDAPPRPPAAGRSGRDRRDDGNFTVRRVAGESGVGTLKADHDGTAAAHRPHHHRIPTPMTDHQRTRTTRTRRVVTTIPPTPAARRPRRCGDARRSTATPRRPSRATDAGRATTEPDGPGRPTPERWYEPAPAPAVATPRSRADRPRPPVGPAAAGTGSVILAAALSAVLASGGHGPRPDGDRRPGSARPPRPSGTGTTRRARPAGHHRRVVGDDRRRGQGQPGGRAHHDLGRRRHEQRRHPRDRRRLRRHLRQRRLDPDQPPRRRGQRRDCRSSSTTAGVLTGTVYGIDTLTDLAIVKVEGTRPADRRARRLRRAQGRPARRRHRQPARHVLELGHQRHRLGQGPVDHDRRQPEPQQPHPDRRGDQPRQLGRPAARRQRQRRRHQHGHRRATATASASPSRSTSPARSWSRRSPARSWPARTWASAT